MPLIGVRELREQTAEVLRQVRDNRTRYVVTRHGRPVAVILPVDTEALEASVVPKMGLPEAGWERYLQLAEELRQLWPPDLDTQSLLDEIRG